MKLFEINSELRNIVDEVSLYAEEHDGEIPENLSNKLTSIQQEKEQKVLSIGRWYKNLNAEAEAIKTEEDRLYSRRKSLEKRIEGIKYFLETYLTGEEKYSDGAVKISFRKSERLSMITEDIRCIPDKYLKPQLPKIDKAAIKDDIKSGKRFDFAKIEFCNNIQIK